MRDEAPPATRAEELVDALASEGTPESDGRFTFERGAARERLRELQLEVPHEYVLEWIQAAVLKGATFVDARVDATVVELRFDGRPFSRQELELLYEGGLEAVPGDRDDWARRELGLGLVSAERLRPRFVRVRSGTGGAGGTLELRPGQPERLGAAPAAPPARPRSSAASLDALRESAVVTTLHARFPRSFSSFGPRPEAAILRARCAYATIPIRLGHEQVSHGLNLGYTVGRRAVSAPGVLGQMGFTPLGRRATVHLVQNGVWLATHLLDTSHEPELLAVVEGEALRVDLSLRRFVEDEAFAAALAAVEAAREAAPERRSLASTLTPLRKALVERELLQLRPFERRRTAAYIFSFACLLLGMISGVVNGCLPKGKGAETLQLMMIGGILTWVVGIAVLPGFFERGARAWLHRRFPDGTPEWEVAREIIRKRAGESAKESFWRAINL